jgi:hypothetical protein
MICTSVYQIIFIGNFIVHRAKKVLLMQPLTFWGDYDIAARRIISGLVLKERNGLHLVIPRRYLPTLPVSNKFPLTDLQRLLSVFII